MRRKFKTLAILQGLALAAIAPSAWGLSAGCAESLAAGDYGRAIAMCTAAIGDGKSDPEELVARGTAYARLGYVDEASADFERAIEMRPGYARAYIQRARLDYMRNADLARGLRYADRAVELAPDDAESHDIRAHILVAMNRLDAGYRAFERALRVGGPDYVRRVQTALQGLDHDPGVIDGRMGPGTRGALRECVIGSGCRLLY